MSFWERVFIDGEFGCLTFFNYFNLIEDKETKSNFIIALKMDSNILAKDMLNTNKF